MGWRWGEVRSEPLKLNSPSQELQLAVNIRVFIFNSRILRTYKKSLDQCGLSMFIGLLRKLQNLLPKTALVTICKAFIRSQFNYDDILYNQA